MACLDIFGQTNKAKFSRESINWIFNHQQEYRSLVEGIKPEEKQNWRTTSNKPS